MSGLQSAARHLNAAIWWDALGYFAAYVPYAALTRALADGRLGAESVAVPGAVLLPAATTASICTAAAFLLATGWWRHASRRRVGGIEVPVATRWTFASGLCSALIIATTTLAYTFENTSALMMVLLMRGGVLALAPVVDVLARRRIKRVSIVALLISIVALFLAVRPGDRSLSLLALADLSIYLAAYFIRLKTMSALAKSNDRSQTLRYFVEEQLVSTPALFCILAATAAAGHQQVREGFYALLGAPWLGWALLIGALSQGTGIFGGLVLLGSDENSYCVPVNRASSVLAGVVAALGLAMFAGAGAVATRELVAAGVLLLAVGVLAAPRLITRAARPATTVVRG